MPEEIKILFSDFFCLLEERNKRVGTKKQLLIVKNKKIGDKYFYQVTRMFPSATITGHVLFPNPPASRSNVYIPLEKLQEVEMVFGITLKEIVKYSIKIADADS